MKILKKNKKMIMGVCALAFSVSLAAGFGVVSTGVSADNVTLQTQANTFTITEGAAVRLAEPYGIRY
ncbi:MAG: hypothetical protein IJB97_05975, partial [Clostridia bacterium]|nr:hypothetical protein [Clostridia bacterium]